ncbi:creatinine amidohydrolase [Melghirimyces profundicolus]|uniref:Creatinine amidohydrolase n=1 Tax=Melghirimyces profundicolus TaxID=1242148 RepID=A0A2T6BQZ4_9BACL|nr:creatininase family protein [Melghirimyces profundicolus]PTX58498.1 creatinine amidohydrolase [Melghirimyces profundicolus]
MQFQEQTSERIRESIKSSPIAILPMGAVEAHGPHLPLGTDNFLAEELSKRLAERVNGWVLPILPYGQVWSLSDFPGSLSVRNETLIHLLTDLGDSLVRQGFRIWVILNAHLGNAVAVKEAARNLYERHPGFRVFYFFYPGTQKVISEVRERPPVHPTYFHACEMETSYMLYLAEEKVDMSKAIDDVPEIPQESDFTPTPWSTFTRSAVLGYATLASREKGERVIEAALDRMTEIVVRAKADLNDEV